MARTYANRHAEYGETLPALSVGLLNDPMLFGLLLLSRLVHQLHTLGLHLHLLAYIPAASCDIDQGEGTVEKDLG